MIRSILVRDPSKRPTVDEIMESEWMTEYEVPDKLPSSTLSVPPSATILKQYESKTGGVAETPVEADPAAASKLKDQKDGKQKGKKYGEPEEKPKL